MKKCLNKCNGDMATETCVGCGRTFEEIREAYKNQVRRTPEK